MHLTDTALSAQSPTTALAKLTFHQPSPAAVSTNQVLPTPGVDKLTNDNELPFPQLPTTSLDKLNFTPCFTKDDASKQLFLQQSVSLSKSCKSKTTATKRPLNDASARSCVDGGANAPANAATSLSNTNINSLSKTAQSQVRLRSPEARANRSVIRPNSIAFSTYPHFDFSSTEGASVVGICSATTDTALSNAHLQTTDLLLTQAKNCRNNWESAQQLSQKASAGAGVHEQSKSHGRKKSRSLEDILNSPNEEVKCGCVGVNRMYCHSNRMLTAAEIFPQSMALENAHQCRCRGADPQHQSSSSISSSGSHNSLQGSVEMIEVS